LRDANLDLYPELYSRHARTLYAPKTPTYEDKSTNIFLSNHLSSGSGYYDDYPFTNRPINPNDPIEIKELEGQVINSKYLAEI
jgi:hypothetical protein